MSLNLEDLRQVFRLEDYEGEGVGTQYSKVSESEILGLAVQLLKDNGYLVEEQATAHWSALTAEERSAMPPNLHRWVTAWEPLVPLSILGEQ